MSNRKEIERAIEQLPHAELLSLAAWIDTKVQAPIPAIPAKAWLEKARGAAQAGVTTAGVMVLTRSEA